MFQLSIGNIFPVEYKTVGSVGFDIPSEESVLLRPGNLHTFKSNIKVTGYEDLDMPYRNELQVRSRSSLAKRGVVVSGGIGTVDIDYRGEIMVTLINLGPDPLWIEPGDRIAQIVECPVFINVSIPVTNLARGTGGHGSTGR
jgi:dUTP pyrophosphatase